MKKQPESLVCFLDEHDEKAGFLVGGYVLAKSLLRELDTEIGRVKSRFGLRESDPVKWNLRDVGYETAKKTLEKRVTAFRRAMFEITKKIPLRLIMSWVWKGDPSYTEEAWEWSFTNVLQRLCYLDGPLTKTREPCGYPSLDVVFDWLPVQKRTRHDEYFDVYRQAYYEGYKFEKNTLWPLKHFGACPCLLVTKTKYSPALQLADFFVGATGDFFSWCYTGKKHQSVRDHFCYFLPSFRKAPQSDDIVGYGLVVKQESQKKIREKLQQLSRV